MSRVLELLVGLALLQAAQRAGLLLGLAVLGALLVREAQRQRARRGRGLHRGRPRRAPSK